MKKRLSLFTLAMVSVLSLTGCDYNYTYEIPSYPIEIEVDDPTKAILPEQIYLSSTKKSMVVGDTYNLLATVAPNNTTDKSLNWSSEDADVVAVGSDGLLTAIGEGTALVSAKSNAKGDVVASCEVRVASKEIHVESLELSTIEETMKVGSKLDIYANISPENATNKNIIWTSSDPEVVSVNGGKIEGISTGVAIITAATEDSNKIQTCTVTVDASEGGEIVAPTSITLNPTSKTVGIGDTFQLIAKVGPENVTDRSVNWKSSNEEVASVSATGSVKALKMGTSVITATASGNTSISATCIVNVTESTISVVAISLSESTKTLEIGQNFSLTATISPTTATNKTISWESSNNSVATVKNGVVTAVAPGNAFITVTTEDGGKQASCAVTVKGQSATSEPGFENTNIDDQGTYDIKIWCDERIKDLMQTQVSNYVSKAKSKGLNYTINLKIDDVSEGDAASMMTEDVGIGADIYVFAQDQLAKLKTAGALAQITGDLNKNVKVETESEGVNAASISNKMYAYPFTSDNGYFLYYDKQIINDQEAQDMEKIVKKCEENDLKFNYSIFGNGFYSASYFMATGCESIWDMDSTNKFCDYHDTYNSENGFKAAKGIQYLAQHNIFGNSDDPSKFGRPKGGIGACVSGIWNYQYALNALGVDRLGCAPMPYFTVGSERYHISSFSGYKLIGVKPQQDAKKVSLCKKLARYLSSEACQLERFKSVGWGPTNINALGKDEVKNHPGLKALRAQQPFSKPQTQCPSSWYGSVSSLAAAIKGNSTDQEIWNQLQMYYDNLESLLND